MSPAVPPKSRPEAPPRLHDRLPAAAWGSAPAAAARHPDRRDTLRWMTGGCLAAGVLPLTAAMAGAEELLLIDGWVVRRSDLRDSPAP